METHWWVIRYTFIDGLVRFYRRIEPGPIIWTPFLRDANTYGADYLARDIIDTYGFKDSANSKFDIVRYPPADFE